MKKFFAGALIVVVSLFVISVSMVLAQDACEGNFDYDKDVDGADASLFKSDFGRSGLRNPCPPDGPAPVPKTGQTTSYVTGDDGDLEKGVAWPTPRFTDNGDGTATDNLTGLIWLKNANCFGIRNWFQAVSVCNGLADGSCGLTDGSNPGDWRLPNYKELLSLIDAENFTPALPTGHPFTGVQEAQYYWSSTTVNINPSFAWVVLMISGQYFGGDKLNTNYLWPVRGGQ